MSDLILKQLLKEYEKKKFIADTNFEYKKSSLYRDYPKLDEINSKINNYAITLSKLILENNIEEYEKSKEEFEKLKKDKELIIKNLNLPDDFFTPNYECKLCNDTGYVIDENNKTVLCSCIKQKLFNIKYNSSNIGDLNKENFATFDVSLYSTDINPDKFKANISPRTNIENIKRIAENFISNFDDPEEKNLLFIGNTGLGKTFLSNCIANELLKVDKTILYQSASSMLDSIID